MARGRCGEAKHEQKNGFSTSDRKTKDDIWTLFLLIDVPDAEKINALGDDDVNRTGGNQCVSLFVFFFWGGVVGKIMVCGDNRGEDLDF